MRELSPATRIEILTPDFRGRMDRALEILQAAPPDVMNHNLETVPRLYKQARPGSDYAYSLNLLKRFKERRPECRPSPASWSAWARPTKKSCRSCATCARMMSTC